MNTTQRKFALKRIYALYCSKASEISKQDKKLNDKYFKLMQINGNTIRKAIKQNLLQLNKKPLGNLDDPKASELFDLSPLTKKGTAFAQKLGGYAYDKPKSYAYNGIIISNNFSNESANNYVCFFNITRSRLEAINKSMEILTDVIMLGDSTEAMDALVKAERRKF